MSRFLIKDIFGHYFLFDRYLNDYFDQICYVVTCMIIIIANITVSTDAFYSNSFSCYPDAVLKTKHMNQDFYKNYCWDKGTYPILINEKVPQNEDQWKTLKERELITYYQWFPIILAVQCFIFYLPQLIWIRILKSRHCFYVNIILSHVQKVYKSSTNQTVYMYDDINNFFLKNINFRRNLSRKTGLFSGILNRLNCMCSLITSRGTLVTTRYMIIKLMHVINPILNLIIVKQCIAFKRDSFYQFFSSIIIKIWTPSEFYLTKYFPLKTLCLMDDIHVLGGQVQFVVNCQHPENAFQKYAVLILSLWLMVLTVIAVTGFLIWICRIFSLRLRVKYVRKLLEQFKKFEDTDENYLRGFVSDFLQQDGLFLIRMLNLQFGEIGVSIILSGLFESYKKETSFDYK